MGHLSAGNLEGAKMRWRKCLELKPDHMVCMFNLATLLAEVGEVQGAVDIMDQVLQLQPGDADNHKTMAILKFKQNKNVESVKHYMKCIKEAPLHADCYCGMGNAFVKEGKYGEAQEAYTAAANLNPGEAGYLNNIGNLLVRHHRFNTTAQHLALKYLTQVPRAAPTPTTAPRSAPRPDCGPNGTAPLPPRPDLVAGRRQAIALDGEYADGYFNLGEAYSAVNMFDRCALPPPVQCASVCAPAAAAQRRLAMRFMRVSREHGPSSPTCIVEACCMRWNPEHWQGARRAGRWRRSRQRSTSTLRVWTTSAQCTSTCASCATGAPPKTRPPPVRLGKQRRAAVFLDSRRVHHL